MYVPLLIGQVDADSPINEPLMTQIKDNLEDLDAARVTGGDSHGHTVGDGNPITQNAIAPSAVGQAELKTASGSVSTQSNPATLTLPGGEYGFYPRIKTSNEWDRMGAAQITFGFTITTYVTTIRLIPSNTTTVYAQQRYIQASPPHELGNRKDWGHFIFVLRNTSTGAVVSSYEAQDPPWAHNGPDHNAKGSIERISAVPHPFIDYWGKDPAIDGLEIVLLDTSTMNMKNWESSRRVSKKSMLEDVNTQSGITLTGRIKKRATLGMPVMPGFTDRVNIREGV